MTDNHNENDNNHKNIFIKILEWFSCLGFGTLLKKDSNLKIKINIISLCCLLLFCISYYIINNQKPIIKNQNYFQIFIKMNTHNKNVLRQPVGLNYTKKPIVLFGCSYTYGFGLSEKDTFGYLLSEYNKRPVFNFGLGASGIQHMYFMIKKHLIKFPEPEFVIYVFIDDHIKRMYVNCRKIQDYDYLTYNLINGKLHHKETSLPKFVYPYEKELKNYFFYKFQYKQTDKNFDLMKAFFIETRKEILKKYPNIKFVILIYDDLNQNFSYCTHQRWQELENENFIIIKSSELTKENLWDKQYKLPQDMHPNAKAWLQIVPELSKKLNL